MLGKYLLRMAGFTKNSIDHFQLRDKPVREAFLIGNQEMLSHLPPPHWRHPLEVKGCIGIVFSRKSIDEIPNPWREDTSPIFRKRTGEKRRILIEPNSVSPPKYQRPIHRSLGWRRAPWIARP